MMHKPRREFLAASGLAMLGVILGGASHTVQGAAPGRSSRPQARAPRRPVLDAGTAGVLGAAGDILLPGAKAAGLVSYVGTQLSLPAHRQVLMIKYLLAPPFRDFYIAGLGALEAVSLARLRQPFARSGHDQGAQLLEDLRNNKLAGWSGPPQPLLHFVLRNDALDVVYGTRAGFNHLGVPYMAHIEPPTDWPA